MGPPPPHGCRQLSASSSNDSEFPLPALLSSPRPPSSLTQALRLACARFSGLIFSYSTTVLPLACQSPILVWTVSGEAPFSDARRKEDQEEILKRRLSRLAKWALHLSSTSSFPLAVHTSLSYVKSGRNAPTGGRWDGSAGVHTEGLLRFRKGGRGPSSSSSASSARSPPPPLSSRPFPLRANERERRQPACASAP